MPSCKVERVERSRPTKGRKTISRNPTKRARRNEIFAARLPTCFQASGPSLKHEEVASRLSLEVGYRAAIRDTPSKEGYTHDWSAYVQPVDSTDFNHVIKRVVFHLHPTFAKPKRILKAAPFVVKESGFASFDLGIEISITDGFRNDTIHHTLDLALQQDGGPISSMERLTHKFYSASKTKRKRDSRISLSDVNPSKFEPNDSKDASGKCMDCPPAGSAEMLFSPRSDILLTKSEMSIISEVLAMLSVYKQYCKDPLPL